MKKFFINGTEEEVKFGDYLELDLVKDDTKKHIECKFIPEILDFLVDEDIIEVKEQNSPKQKKAACLSLEDRLTALEEAVAELLAVKDGKRK